MILDVRILQGLRVTFVEVRIVKELAGRPQELDCGSAWVRRALPKAQRRGNEVKMSRRNKARIGKELCERVGRTKDYLPLLLPVTETTQVYTDLK